MLVSTYIAVTAGVLSLATMHSARAEWSGGIEGGTVFRDSGNAARLRLTLRNNERPLTHYLYAEWLRGGSDDNSYSLGYNPRYWFNQTYYTFGESRIRQDEPLDIDQEIQVIAGVGGQFISDADQALYAEVGLGGRSIDFEGVDDASNEAIGVARLGYSRTLADTIKLDFALSGSQSSDEVTEASTEVGLSLRIPSGAVRVAYRTRYIKVDDFDSVTDDDTFLSFDYSF